MNHILMNHHGIPLCHRQIPIATERLHGSDESIEILVGNQIIEPGNHDSRSGGEPDRNAPHGDDHLASQ